MPPSRDLFIFLLFSFLKFLSNAQELENESEEFFELKPSIAINNSSDVIGSGEPTFILPSKTESSLSTTTSTQVLKPTLTVTATRIGTTRYFHPIEPQMSPPTTTFPPDDEEGETTTLLPFSTELEDMTDENYQTIDDEDLNFLQRSGEPIDLIQPSASELVNVRVKNSSEVLPKPDALMSSLDTPPGSDLENEFAEAFQKVGPNGRRRRLRPLGDGSRNPIIRKRIRMRRVNGTGRPFEESTSMVPGESIFSISTKRPMVRRFRSTTTTPVPDPSPPTILPFSHSNDESKGRNYEGKGTLLKKSPFRFNPNFLNSGGLTGSSISSQIEKPGPYSEKDNSYFLIEKPNNEDEDPEHPNHKIKNETRKLSEEKDPHFPLDFEDERSQWEKNYMNLQQHSFYGTSAEEGSGGITSLNSDLPSPNESTGDEEFVMKEKEVSEASGAAANHGSLGEFISSQPTTPPQPQSQLPHQSTQFHFGSPNQNMDHPQKSIVKRMRQRMNPNYIGERNKEGPPTSEPPKLLEPEPTASPADVSQPPISGPSGDGNSLGAEPSAKNPMSEQSSFSSAYAPPMDQQFGPSGTDSIFSKVPIRGDPRSHHRHPIFDSHFPRDPNIFPDHLPSSPSQPSNFEDIMKMKEANFYGDGEPPHEESHISESPYPSQSNSVGPGVHFNQRQHPHPPPPPHAAQLINYPPQHSNPPPPPPPPLPQYPLPSGPGSMRPSIQEPHIVHYNGPPQKSESYSNSEFSFPKSHPSNSFPPPRLNQGSKEPPFNGNHYDDRTRQAHHENIGPKGPHAQAHVGGSSNYENHYEKQSEPKETRPTLTLPMPGLVNVPTPPPEGLALSEVTPNRHFPPHTHSMSNNPDYEPANPPLPNGHPLEHHFDPFIQNANEFKDEGQDNHFRNYNPSGPQSEYSSNAYTGDSLLHFHPEGHGKEPARYEDYRDEGPGPNGPYEGRPGPPRPRPPTSVTKRKPSYKTPKKGRSKSRGKPSNTPEESESYLVEEENEPNVHYHPSYDEDEHHYNHDFPHDDSMFGPGPDEFSYPSELSRPRKKHREPSRPQPTPQFHEHEEQSEESEGLKEEKTEEPEEEGAKESKDAKKAASKNPYSQVPYVLMFHNMLPEDQGNIGVMKGLKSPTTGKEMSLGSASSISSLGPDGVRTGEIKNLGPGLQAVPVHPRDQMIQVLATSQYEKLLSTKKKEKKKPPSAIFTPYGVLVPMGLKASASTSSHYHTGPDHQYGPPATATGYQTHDHHPHNLPHHDVNEKELLNILLQANIGPFGKIGFHKKANLKNGRIKSHVGLRANLEPALDLLAEKLSLKLGALEYLIRAPHTAIGFHYSQPHHEYPKQESSYSEITPVKMFKAPNLKGKKEKGPGLKSNVKSSEFKTFIKQLLKERLYEMLDEARDEEDQGGAPKSKGNFRSMKPRKRPSKENENGEGKMYPFPLQSVITPTHVAPPKPPVRSKGFFSTIKNLFSFGRETGTNSPSRLNGTNMWEFKSPLSPVFKATQAPELEKILNSQKPRVDQTRDATTKGKEMKKLESSKKRKEVKEKPDDKANNKKASKDFNKWLDLVLKSAADSKFSSAEKKLVLEKLIFPKKGEAQGWKPKKSDKEPEEDMVGSETEQIGVKVPPPPSFFNFTGGKWWKEEMIPMSRASKWRPVFYLASPLHKNKQ